VKVILVRWLWNLSCQGARGLAHSKTFRSSLGAKRS